VQDSDWAIELLKALLAAYGDEALAVSSQPGLLERLAEAYMDRGNARQGQQEFASAAKDYDWAIELLERLLKVGRQSVLGDYFLALRNRIALFFAQQDFAAVPPEFLMVMTKVVQVYREVGQQICVPSVAREFAVLDQLAVYLQVEATLEDELRSAWSELRELFAA
jgi:tetratricopeptide (TPR) repeat protein